MGELTRRQMLSSIGVAVGGTVVSGRAAGRQTSDKFVYAATEAGELVAFSAATGETQWKYAFPNDPELVAKKGGPPLVWNGAVYLGAQRRLHAVDAATGEREWVYEGAYGATWPPTVHDGTVYVVNNTGALTGLEEEGDLDLPGVLYALDAETGERRWRADSPMLSGYAQAPLVYDGTVVALGSHFSAISLTVGGTVSAYDAKTGAQRWGQVSPYGDLPVKHPRYGPVEVDGIVYIMGSYGAILGFDPETGEHVSRGGSQGRLGATPHAPSRGKLSAYGKTLLSANGDRLDRFLPQRDGESRVPGTTRGGHFSFDYVGELPGVASSFKRSSFVVGRPSATQHPYLVAGAKQWEGGAGAEAKGSARYQATSMNPVIATPGPEWTYEQPTLVNPTVAGRAVFIGGGELTALDLQDGTERWSSGAFDGRIVTAPTVAANPESGHSIDERIRHQTINHHDALGPRPASFRVGGGRLSAAGLSSGDEYLFPDDDIGPRVFTDDEPRDDGLAYATYDRLVGRTDADGRIVIPGSALEEFRAELSEPLGLIVQIHNVGGVTTEKPVEVIVGGMSLETTVQVQGYGAGSLYLFEDIAAVPEYARSSIEADSARTYIDGAAFVDVSGDRLLGGDSGGLTISTPDHERTIRFETVAASDTPEATETPIDTESPTGRTDSTVDSEERVTTGASGPGFGVGTGLAAIAAGGYARYVSKKRDEER